MPVDPALVIALAATLVAVLLATVAVRRGREVDRLRRASEGDGSTAANSAQPADWARAADLTGAGLLRVDRANRIVEASEAAHTLMARERGALVGRSLMEGFVDHRVEDVARDARRRGAARLALLVGGEPPLTLELAATAGGGRGDVWIVLRDVSELHRLRRIQSEFIDNLAHELRTPLTTVRLLAESLAIEGERTALPPRVRESISRIDVETGHLAQMVNELLDLSRIEQGEAQLVLDDVDLGRVVEAALGRLRLYAERQGVALRGEMPGTAAERTVRADEERIGQLLVNLVHNAVKFSPPESEVVVRIRSAERELRLEVADQGPGIPRRELERIFERFYKVDRARPRGGGGTGLGLSIARHIAERHGGRIWAESVEGSGSTFFVALPRDGAASGQGAHSLDQDQPAQHSDDEAAHDDGRPAQP